MKYSIGNEKLGTQCFVVSRAVGPTCPSTCYFLDNGCYAQVTERIFPQARKVGESNEIVDWQDIVGLIEKALNKGFSIRLHERGDFGRDDKLDLRYVNSWVRACRKFEILPNMWAYTHFYSNELVKRLGGYIRLYASIHNKRDYRAAKSAGFNLFAYIDTNHLFMDKKRRGVNPDVPKHFSLYGEHFLVCPEQRMGRDRVTCTGGKTLACNWCVKKNRFSQNVAFVEH